MAIPSGLGSLKDLKKREAKAFEEDAKWHDLLDDVYEFFLPNRNLFNRDDKGQKKMDRIFDSTALNAIQQGASKLQENIAPIWSDWALLEPSAEIQRMLDSGQFEVSEEDIRKRLEDQSATIFDYINRSNFGTQFYEAALDILIGTATLRIDEEDDDEMPINFSVVPQRGVAFEEGPQGTIETHWRRMKVKARHLERKWAGFTPSSSMADFISNSPDADVDVHEGVIYDPKTKEYYALVWVKDEDHISWEQGFGESSPWVTGRYFKVSGEVRGRGPAVQALADVRTINKIKEFVLQKSAIDLAGMYTATDDGVTNPYTLTISPGVVIPVGSNNNANPSLLRLDTGNDLNLALFEVEELQRDIRTALFNDLRDPDGPVRSATEVAIESRELAKRIGSAFGRLQTEILVPVLRRVAWILARRGLIDSIQVGGRDIAVKFTSPLARAQDMEDLMAAQQAVEFTMMTAGPDQAKMAFKLEDFGTWAAEKTGMPAELVRSDAEKAKVIQAGAQAAMMGANVESQPPETATIQ